MNCFVMFCIFHVIRKNGITFRLPLVFLKTNFYVPIFLKCLIRPLLTTYSTLDKKNDFLSFKTSLLLFFSYVTSENQFQ